MSQDGTKLVRSGKLIRLAETWEKVAGELDRLNTPTSTSMAIAWRSAARNLRTELGIENPGE